MLGRNAGQRSLLQMPAVPVAGACATGILAANYLPIDIVAWLLLSVGSLVLLVGFKGARGSRWCLMAFVALTMATWTAVQEQPPESSDVSFWAPEKFQPVVVRGVIASTVQLRPNSLAETRPDSDTPAVRSSLELRLSEVRDGSLWRPVSGKVRMIVNGDASEFLIGDRVTVYGQLARIGPPTNPGETDFRTLFSRRGIRGRMAVDTVSQIVLEEAGCPGFMRMLSWISSRGDRVLQNRVGDRQGQLASAIVLGRRLAVPPRTRDLLVETGTVHLLSVSGLHLAMVAGLAKTLMLLTGLNRAIQMVVVLFVCVFFAGLTGANPPVLRASFLVATVLFASWAARIPHTINSLAIAAILLMILHPSTLLETGAQLSFIAVATLVVTGRSLADIAKQDIAVQKVLEESRTRWYVYVLSSVRNLIAATKVSFWVWLVTAPLVWHAYHVLAPVSVLSNLLVVPLLGIALTFGLLTASIGMGVEVLAIPFGFACKLALAAILGITSFFAELPFAFFWLPAPPAWLVVLYYLGLLVPTLLAHTHWLPETIKFPLHFRLGWSLCWFCFAVPISLHKFEKPNENLTVTFIDVGHGTSVLIQLPDGQGTWLYDAGRLGDPTWSITPIEDVLWDAGVRTIDGLIISHADADHYNAVPDLLRRFNVRAVYVPPGFDEDQQVGLIPLKRALEKYQTTVNVIHVGSMLHDASGNVWGVILHPDVRRTVGSDNSNSIVLQIDCLGMPVLLPGDLEHPGTESVLRLAEPRPGGVMMAPHHGSLQEDVRPLLDWFKPTYVVVSGGNRSARPAVKQMQSQTGATCIITAERGAVRISMRPDGDFTVAHWDQDHWSAQ